MFGRTSVLFAVEWYDYEINAGVAAYAREAGWILSDAITYCDLQGRLMQPYRSWSGQGVITLINHADSALARYVSSLDVPVVDLVDEAAELPFSRVIADNRAIGAMAAAHLMDLGLEHLAFQRLFDARVTDSRLAGFQEAAAKAGKTFHLVDFTRSPRGLNADVALAPWLAEQLARIPTPFGLMMQHDGESMISFSACQMAGLAIPRDAAIIGVDNNELACELGPIGLTSIDRNRRRHGYEAAAALDRLLHGAPPLDEPILIPPREAVVRESTDTLTFRDPEMLRAVRFLRGRFRDPEVGVDDIVQASGLSRRKAYYLFKQHFGRGLQEELTHLRLEEARRLLATTNLKVFAVAMEAGFASERQLARACKAELGMSPRAYRERCAAPKAGRAAMQRDARR